jgi:two-component system, NarL family, sensor kinase
VSKSQFIKLSGLAFLAGSFAFVAILRGSFSSTIISSIVLAIGMLALRAGYGESVGRFGKNILLIGVVGMVLTYLSIFILLQIKTSWKFDLSNWWFLGFAGPAILLLALTLFGLTALRSKPMSRFNGLPILAGIWFPVIYFSFITYVFTNNGTFPAQFPYTAIEIMIVIQFLALCLLGFILVTDVLDVEILINRTLVYGALTASVVGLYVLLVGGVGILFQMQNNLPGIIISILLIAFLFRPLHQCLQGIADRFVPVSQSTLPVEQHEREIVVSQPNSEIPSQPGINGKKTHLWVWVPSGILVCIIVLNLARSLFLGQALADWSKVVQGLLWSLLPLVFAFISALIITRQPRNMIGWLLMALPLMFILDDLFSLEISSVTTAPSLPSLALFLAIWFGSIEWVFMIVPFFLIFFLFPTGAPPSPRWRWVIPYVVSLVVFFITVTTFAPVLPPNRGLFSMDWSLVNPIGFIPPDVAEVVFSICLYLALALLAVLCVASLFVRYRQAGAVEKKQIQWLLFASSLFALILLVLGFTQSQVFLNFLFPLVMMGIPMSIGIAILRYRLWDIDFIINRTLVYGALTIGIVALYIFLVGALSLVSQTSGNLLISLLATGMIAFLFQPLRERLQRGVNHLIYGERDEPYVVLSQLGQRLETALAPTAVLSTIVETIGHTLKLPFVEIRLCDSAAEAVSFGEHQTTTIAIPLAYQDEAIGELHVTPRAGESLSSADQNLLKDLARQIEIAIHAAQVTVDLQRSRERLVLAREEERRRLRRDLHDDLAPTLASLGLTASTAADLIETNPTTAKKLVKELQNEIRATVGNIRRLVYDLRPPTLDELGLLAAVRERAAQYSNAPYGFRVRVDVPVELPALPAAVEVAAYRIVQEALENVSKHSQAGQCVLRFANHNGLEIEITDDGIGLPPNITPGVGLRSMRERAEELGGTCVIERCLSGGTRILARLPIGGFDGTVAHPDRR